MVRPLYFRRVSNLAGQELPGASRSRPGCCSIPMSRNLDCRLDLLRDNMQEHPWVKMAALRCLMEISAKNACEKQKQTDKPFCHRAKVSLTYKLVHITRAAISHRCSSVCISHWTSIDSIQIVKKCQLGITPHFQRNRRKRKHDGAPDELFVPFSGEY